MNTPSSLEDLIKALRCLPGVGPKSAQRMAYHLLQRDRQGALQLARSLGHAVESVKHCSKCNNFSEEEVCALCRSERSAAECAAAMVAAFVAHGLEAVAILSLGEAPGARRV